MGKDGMFTPLIHYTLPELAFIGTTGGLDMFLYLSEPIGAAQQPPSLTTSVQSPGPTW